MAKLAQAGSSEFFSKWGEPGNQRRTKQGLDGELNVSDVPREGGSVFTVCMRWRDMSLAKRAAELAYEIVKNEKVGYSQNNGASPRTSLIDELRKCHWVPADIKNKCNCDCSSLQMTLMRYNDLDSISEDMWTGDQLKQMRATGAFTEIKIADPKTFKYQVGDILWREGHTAMVIEGDEDPIPEADEYAYIWNCSAANVREGTTVNTKTVGTVHAGDVLPYLGEAENGWIKVKLGSREGYVSNKYAHRMQHGFIKGNCWMRKEADSSNDKNQIVVVHAGETVFLTGDTKMVKKLWYYAYYKGNFGWMSSLYCKPGTEEEIYGNN